MGRPQVKVKRPNAIIYFFTYIIIYPLLKILFLMKTDRKNFRTPKGPFIFICNHASFIDFLMAMLSIYPRRLNAVVAQKYFLYKPLDKFLPMVGCIPKNLFDPDIRPIMGIKAVLNQGGAIFMFPEGRCSTDGNYCGMHSSTGKLIKKMAVPVVSCHIEGTYNCMPFWRKGIRFGRVRLTIANLFSAENLKTLSVDEINKAIDGYLGGKEAQPPSKPFRVFKAKRLGVGLENILYICPKCKKEFTLETSGNSISCKSCGNAAVLDREMKLSAAPDSAFLKTIHECFKEQVLHELSLLKEDKFPEKTQVTVRMPSKDGIGIKLCGKGDLWLERDGWHYAGELNGENANHFFPIDNVPAIPFDPNDNFQIYANGNLYIFTPDDAQKCVKFSVAGECAYWLFASSVQMTKGRDSAFDRFS